jgi:hypothetical protein
MSGAQRLGFLAIAAVIAVAAVIILSTSGDDEEPAATSAGATATPAATETAAPGETATETPTPTPKPEPQLLTAGKLTKLRFEQGERVSFRVRADVTDHVHVHGYDLMKDIEPGKTIEFSFPARITGIFEIELEAAGEQIGQLRVDPE